MKSATEYAAIEPHGGKLVDRRVAEEEYAERFQRAEELPKVALGPRTLSDLEMISTGVCAAVLRASASVDPDCHVFIVSTSSHQV